MQEVWIHSLQRPGILRARHKYAEDCVGEEVYNELKR